jgi:hypothetical protein
MTVHELTQGMLRLAADITSHAFDLRQMWQQERLAEAAITLAVLEAEASWLKSAAWSALNTPPMIEVRRMTVKEWLAGIQTRKNAERSEERSDG